MSANTLGTLYCGTLESAGVIVRGTRPPKRPRPNIGERFGQWVVTGPTVRRPRGIHRSSEFRAPCICDCGTARYVAVTALQLGRSTSCGCVVGRGTKTIKKTCHGLAGTRLYRVWAGMKARCGYTSIGARHYADRGITVCKQWQRSFVVFRDWALRHGYADDLQLDRRNNNGPYTPSNCRWVTRLTNVRNSRHNHFVRAFGATKCISEWAEDKRCVVRLKTLRQRIGDGWTIERALTQPLQHG